MEADSSQPLPKGKVAITSAGTEPVDSQARPERSPGGRESGSERAPSVVDPSGGEETGPSPGDNGHEEGAATQSDAVLTLASEEDILKELTGAPAIPGTGITRIIDTVPDQIRNVSSGRTMPSLSIDERLGRLILSAVLAVLLWIYVVNLENPTLSAQFKELNLDVRGGSPNVKIVTSPAAVDITVQGPQSVLETINKSSIRAFVDVSGLNEGVHRLPVQADISSDHARDLSHTFSPSLAQVQLELQVTQVFSVVVQTNGTPAIGYGLEPAQVTPESAKLTGSRDAIARVARVITQVDVEGKAGTQQGNRPMKALDAAGAEVTGLTFDPPNVQVVVPIKLLFNYKVVPVRVPLIGQPAAGYQVTAIEYNPTSVTVCCSPGLLEPLQFLDAAPVPITGTTSTVITTTQLVLPRGVDLYPGQPSEISVTVKVETFETTLPVTVAPTVDGLQAGYSTVVSPNRIEVSLAGTFSQLQTLAPSDVQAVINVQGRPAGTYALTPQIIVPQGIKLQSTVPTTVTVTLIAPTPVPLPTQTPVPLPTATHTLEPVPTATQQPTRQPAAPTATVALSTPAPTHSTTATPVLGSPSPTPAPVTPTPTPTP